MKVNCTIQQNLSRHTVWPVVFVVTTFILVTTTGCGNNSSSSQIVVTPTPTLSPTDTITPRPTTADTPTPTLSPTDTITPQPTATDILTPTLSLTAAPTRAPSCSWQWGSKDLPDQTETVSQVLLAAGIPVTNLRVSAYGENYVCDGVVRSFNRMDTSLSMSIIFDTDATLAALGDTTAKVIAVLIEAQSLYSMRDVTLSIASKSENISVRFQPGSGEFQEVYNQNLTGVELLEALGYTTTP